MAQSGSQEGPLLSGVATRYASALFDLARDERAIDTVAADLDRFDRLIQDSSDLLRLIRSPVFTAEQQEAAINAILARAGVAGLAGNFIRVVAAKRRLFALPDMIRSFRELVAEAKGIVRAQVTLAQPPSEKVTGDITSALREVARSEIALDIRVDPTIIGGLIVKIGSRMIDASVRSKLNSIRLSLNEAR